MRPGRRRRHPGCCAQLRFGPLRTREPPLDDDSVDVAASEPAVHFMTNPVAGLAETALSARVSFATSEDWWEPHTPGVGPPGAYVASLDEPARGRLAGRCAELLGPAPFEIEAVAWTALGRS